MKTKQKTILILLLILTLLALAACSNSKNACPTPTAATKLLTNPEEGYCVLYPAEYSTTVPHFIVINPISSPGDMPGDAWLNIATIPATGRTAAQFADESIAAVGEGFNITRFDAQVDGEPATVVDGLPGQDSVRYVFIVHNDRLYTLSFMPWYPNPADPTPLEGLYALVMDTFRFLPEE